jgi:hypothetical protein
MVYVQDSVLRLLLLRIYVMSQATGGGILWCAASLSLHAALGEDEVDFR